MKEITDLLETIKIAQTIISEDRDKITQRIAESRNSFLHGSENYQKCQIEIDVLNIYLQEVQIVPKFFSTHPDGKPFVYPSLANFTDENFNYLQKRLDETRNLYLKAKYAHVLWLHTKRENYGIISAEAHADIARTLYELLINDFDINCAIEDNLKNAIVIASSFKRKPVFLKVKVFFLQIVNDFRKFEDTFVSKFLIFFMLQKDSIFKKDDFENLAKKTYSLAQKHNRESKIELLEIGQKIDFKLGQRSSVWDEETAQCYEEIANDGENDISCMEAAQNAIKHYKKIKNEIKIKELTKRYNYLKEGLRLKNIRTSVNQAEIIENVNKIVSGLTSEQIIQYLMYDKEVIPEYDEIENWAKKTRDKHTILYAISIGQLDANKHISQHFETPEEKENQSVLQSFGLHLDSYLNTLLGYLFSKSIIHEKMSGPIFYEFILNRSWLAKPIEKNNIKYSWLALIMPAIDDYFTQLQFYYLNRRNYINLVLCTDSLVLKIEGILRDICELRDGITSFQTTDNKGRNITREKDINTLLYDEKIVSFISKEDLLFLRFLLVEQSGYNLRNDIAHALLRFPQQYSPHFMNLLILAVLKLAKDEYNPLQNNQ